MAKAKTEETAPEAQPGTWQAPSKLKPASLAVIIGFVVLVNVPLIHYFVFRSQMPANTTLPFRDTFDSSETIKQHYWSSGGLWRAQDGWLFSPGVKQNPLWLRADLPNDVAVEFDVKSMSPQGDVKVEIFGDGSDHASGYVLIHGGWNNALSIIARLDEHGPRFDTVPADNYRDDTRCRVEANPFPVEIGRTYHWRIERREATINWFIDGAPFMSFTDPKPLTGKGHNRFGFSSWESWLYFDNLSVTPL